MMRGTRYTLLYDGNCRLCSEQVQTVARYDEWRCLDIVAIQSMPADRFPPIAPADARRELHLVAPDGTVYRGAEAIRQTLVLLPRLRGLGMLMYLPGVMALAHPVYAWVAQNRYQWWGRTLSCDDGACAVESVRSLPAAPRHGERDS